MNKVKAKSVKAWALCSKESGDIACSELYFSEKCAKEVNKLFNEYRVIRVLITEIK